MRPGDSLTNNILVPALWPQSASGFTDSDLNLYLNFIYSIYIYIHIYTVISKSESRGEIKPYQRCLILQ